MTSNWWLKRSLWRIKISGYGSIPINTIFRGMNIHPFTSYFDVHQGYKVLTHCHQCSAHSIPTFDDKSPQRRQERGWGQEWTLRSLGSDTWRKWVLVRYNGIKNQWPTKQPQRAELWNYDIYWYLGLSQVGKTSTLAIFLHRYDDKT